MTSRLFKAGQNSDVIEPDYLVRMDVLEYFPEEDLYVKCEFCEGKGSAIQTGDNGPVHYECFDCEGKGYIPYSDVV